MLEALKFDEKMGRGVVVVQEDDRSTSTSASFVCRYF